MSKIISRARQARMKHGLKKGRIVTAREVAEAIGISETTLSRIEQDKTERIDFNTLSKLCDYYGVGVGEILEHSPEDIKMADLESMLEPAL